MLRVLPKFLAVVGMAMVTSWFNSEPAEATESCAGGLVICSTACPPYPNYLCKAYGCSGAGASCVYQNCGGVEYAVRCEPA